MNQVKKDPTTNNDFVDDPVITISRTFSKVAPDGDYLGFILSS